MLCCRYMNATQPTLISLTQTIIRLSYDVILEYEPLWVVYQSLMGLHSDIFGPK